MAVKNFLDRTGTQYLAEQLFQGIEQKLQSRLITSIDQDSTDQQIPTGSAIWDLVQAALANISGLDFNVVTELPTTGENGIIYLVKANIDPNDNTYVQWIYVDDTWINLGTSELDLSNYWTKDELEALSNADIDEILEAIFD